MSSKKSKNTTAKEISGFCLEFSAGPGVAGKQAPHVQAAEAAFNGDNFEKSSNGIVTTVEGALPDLAQGLAEAILQAFESGATHFRTVIRTNDDLSAEGRQHIAAMERVANSLGGEVIAASDARPEDIPLEWDNKLIAAVRSQPGSVRKQESLSPVMQQVEEKFGDLQSLTRQQKREVINWLDEREVFQVRKSVESIAVRMKISRATVYNYLNAIRNQ
ncbi:MAG: helix-turn-helix domain-containing protein [Kordiimonadaceae bacterium]|nr:helix-turn-helix domain-containing protein [Kordiimonadaceae bacterium]